VTNRDRPPPDYEEPRYRPGFGNVNGAGSQVRTWLLTLFGSVICLGLGGAATWLVRVESRLTRVETISEETHGFIMEWIKSHDRGRPSTGQ